MLGKGQKGRQVLLPEVVSQSLRALRGNPDDDSPRACVTPARDTGLSRVTKLPSGPGLGFWLGGRRLAAVDVNKPERQPDKMTAVRVAQLRGRGLALDVLGTRPGRPSVASIAKMAMGLVVFGTATRPSTRTLVNLAVRRLGMPSLALDGAKRKGGRAEPGVRQVLFFKRMLLQRLRYLVCACPPGLV